MLGTVLSSLVLIIVLHYTYIFLRDSLTVPKVRDLVGKPQERCYRMLSISQRGPEGIEKAAPSATREHVPDTAAMKTELGAFIRQLQSTGGSCSPVAQAQ